MTNYTIGVVQEIGVNNVLSGTSSVIITDVSLRNLVVAIILTIIIQGFFIRWLYETWVTEGNIIILNKNKIKITLIIIFIIFFILYVLWNFTFQIRIEKF